MDDSTDGRGVRKFEYNGREYILHKLPALQASRVMTRLMKLFGNTAVQMFFGAVAAKIRSDHDPSRTTEDEVAELVQKLSVFHTLRDDDLVDLQRMMFPYVWIGSKRIMTRGEDSEINQAFDGYEVDCIRVLLEAISYNFRPILPANLLALFRRGVAASQGQQAESAVQ